MRSQCYSEHRARATGTRHRLLLGGVRDRAPTLPEARGIAGTRRRSRWRRTRPGGGEALPRLAGSGSSDRSPAQPQCDRSDRARASNPRFEHGIPAGKRPEAAVALKTEGRESLLDLGAVGHDDIDVAGEIEASRPVRDREPSDNDGPNLDRPKRSVDDPSDLEHLLRPIGNVGGALKLNSKPVEISAVWMPGHSVASPSTSRPRRRQPWLTIGPSVAGANRSNISARSRSNSARKVGSRNQAASIR
jgi:hypothetical protein